MKKLFVSILIITMVFIKSQTHRFIYEVFYKNDSTSEKIDKMNMVLDLNQNHTLFYEHKALEIDSLNNLDQNSVFTITSTLGKLKREVSSITNQNFYLLGDNYYYFETNSPISWQIESEIKHKNNMKLQKATTFFSGRNWVAWFNKEIPFSEGPYKFVGLPGLIVEIEEEKGNFKFELIKIEKPIKYNPEILENLFRKKPLEISLLKYNELLLNHYQNPYLYYKNMRVGTWSIITDDNKSNKYHRRTKQTR